VLVEFDFEMNNKKQVYFNRKIHIIKNIIRLITYFVEQQFQIVLYDYFLLMRLI